MPVPAMPVPNQGCLTAPRGHPILSILFLAEEAPDPRWMGTSPRLQPPPACFHHLGWIIHEVNSPGALNRIPGSPLDPGQEGSGRQRSIGRTGQRPGDLGGGLGGGLGGRMPASLLAGWLEWRGRCVLGGRMLGSLGSMGPWDVWAPGCLDSWDPWVLGTFGSLGRLDAWIPASLGCLGARTPGSLGCLGPWDT